MFADLELARRLENAEGSAGAAFVRTRGGDAACRRIGGIYLMFDGVGSPLTQTFGLGISEAATETSIAEAEDFFRTRGASADHEVCPLGGVELQQMLVGRGYIPLELSSVLFLDLSRQPAAPPLNPKLKTRLADGREADAYARAMAEGWREEVELSTLLEDMGRSMFTTPGYTAFVVEQEGRIIATAGLVIHGGVALLAGGSTLPEARQQGAQRAVLAERLAYAAESGCDVAMLVAAPGGASQRNAERNGFRVAYTRTKWRKLFAPPAV